LYSGGHAAKQATATRKTATLRRQRVNSKMSLTGYASLCFLCWVLNTSAQHKNKPGGYASLGLGQPFRSLRSDSPLVSQQRREARHTLRHSLSVLQTQHSEVVYARPDDPKTSHPAGTAVTLKFAAFLRVTRDQWRQAAAYPQDQLS